MKECTDIDVWDYSAFQIGRIVVSGELDREISSEYVIVVIATDSATNSETQEVSASRGGRGATPYATLVILFCALHY